MATETTASDDGATARSSSVQSVDRVVDLLELLADRGGQAALSELAAATGLPMPTIHRLMRTLLARGYVRQLPSRQYALGARLIRLGERAERQFGADARPLLSELATALGESVNLAMIDRDMAVYIGQASSGNSMRMFTEVGRRVHLHSTGVGKVLLSELGDDAVREIARRTGLPSATVHTITDIDPLLAEIAVVRARGYAIDEAEQEIGVRCYAVAIPGAPIPTALSVSGPDSRVTGQFGERAVPALHAVAARVATVLAEA